jgi:hypothetical protein
MSWPRALAAWLLIVAAETLHGTLRQLFIAPLIGDLPARQAGVAVGSGIIFVIAWACIRWIGARTLADQLKVGAAWVVLIVAFEITLGILLGYTTERLLADYNPAAGGFMGFGLLFMLFAPALAARARGVGART